MHIVTILKLICIHISICMHSRKYFNKHTRAIEYNKRKLIGKLYEVLELFFNFSL